MKNNRIMILDDIIKLQNLNKKQEQALSEMEFMSGLSKSEILNKASAYPWTLEDCVLYYAEYGKWPDSRTVPSLVTLCKLADHFGLTFSEMMANYARSVNLFKQP